MQVDKGTSLYERAKTLARCYNATNDVALGVKAVSLATSFATFTYDRTLNIISFPIKLLKIIPLIVSTKLSEAPGGVSDGRFP